MVRLKKDNLVVGLDVGTTKILAIAAIVNADRYEVIGVGKSPSVGLRKGVVVNIESTVRSIQQAITEAEKSAGRRIQSAYAGIAGSHIQGFNSTGVVAIKNGEVTRNDIDRVIDSARAISSPVDREILHVLPQEFIIDGQDGIREPLGMSGTRLEARIHVVTGAIASAQNIVKSAERCGLIVNDIVIEQIASGMSVLTEDEKELGVALVDIGGGTSDIAIFARGAVQQTSVIPIGGQHLTNDIAIGLRTPYESAEIIKKRWGCSDSEHIGKDEVIEVKSIGTRPNRIINRQVLGDILEPRVDEMLELLAIELERIGLCDLLASGVVLTGGTTLLPGFIEKAESILGLPVRHGIPSQIKGLSESLLSPAYATGVGLVQYGSQHLEQQLFVERENNLYTKMRRKMQSWIKGMI